MVWRTPWTLNDQRAHLETTAIYCPSIIGAYTPGDVKNISESFEANYSFKG